MNIKCKITNFPHKLVNHYDVAVAHLKVLIVTSTRLWASVASPIRKKKIYAYRKLQVDETMEPKSVDKRQSTGSSIGEAPSFHRNNHGSISGCSIDGEGLG